MPQIWHEALRLLTQDVCDIRLLLHVVVPAAHDAGWVVSIGVLAANVAMSVGETDFKISRIVKVLSNLELKVPLFLHEEWACIP
jgi:hypothetical protein